MKIISIIGSAFLTLIGGLLLFEVVEAELNLQDIVGLQFLILALLLLPAHKVWDDT